MKRARLFLVVAWGIALGGLGGRSDAAESLFSSSALPSPNLNFEKGSNGWSGVDEKVWLISTKARSGGSALQRVLYAGTAARELPWELQYSESLPVIAGKTWLVEGYVCLGLWDTAIKTALRLQFFNPAGKLVSTFDTSPLTPPLNPHFNNYSRIAGTNRVPAGAVTAKLSVLVFVDAPLTTTRYVKFDDLRVGDFDKLVAEEIDASHAAPKPAPIRLDPESAGPITQGVLNLGKFYKISRLPLGDFADRCTNKWTDGARLTDGESQTGSSFIKEQYVGWQGGDPVAVVFDLGRPQGLETICVRSVYNTASNFAWPKEVRVRTRADRNGSWVDWKTITPAAPSVEGPQVITGSSSLTQALEVEVTVSPAASSTNTLMLISEIELAGAIKNSWRKVPAEGAYHGAYSPDYGFDVALRGGQKDKVRIDLFEETVGKPLALVLWYQGMSPGRNFEEIQEIRRRYLSEKFYGHRILSVGWLPPKEVSVTDIAEGKYDDFFEQYFRDSVDPVVLMGNDDPVWFRPMNEFNTTWTGWSRQPEAFRKAWQRIYNIAEKIGAAQKHLFVWGPNHMSYPDEDWNKMEKYWPGDQYVDWVGISCYPPSRKYVKDDGDMYPMGRFKEVYSKYGSYKPLMVTEGGYGPDHVDKVRWVDEWFQLPAVYPNVRAFIWENHGIPGNNRVIQSSEDALKLYREKVQDVKWISTTYAE